MPSNFSIISVYHRGANLAVIEQLNETTRVIRKRPDSYASRLTQTYSADPRSRRSKSGAVSTEVLIRSMPGYKETPKDISVEEPATKVTELPKLQAQVFFEEMQAFKAASVQTPTQASTFDITSQGARFVQPTRTEPVQQARSSVDMSIFGPAVPGVGQAAQQTRTAPTPSFLVYGTEEYRRQPQKPPVVQRVAEAYFKYKPKVVSKVSEFGLSLTQSKSWPEFESTVGSQIASVVFPGRETAISRDWERRFTQAASYPRGMVSWASRQTDIEVGLIGGLSSRAGRESIKEELRYGVSVTPSVLKETFDYKTPEGQTNIYFTLLGGVQLGQSFQSAGTIPRMKARVSSAWRGTKDTATKALSSDLTSYKDYPGSFLDDTAFDVFRSRQSFSASKPARFEVIDQKIWQKPPSTGKYPEVAGMPGRTIEMVRSGKEYIDLWQATMARERALVPQSMRIESRSLVLYKEKAPTKVPAYATGQQSPFIIERTYFDKNIYKGGERRAVLSVYETQRPSQGGSSSVSYEPGRGGMVLSRSRTSDVTAQSKPFRMGLKSLKTQSDSINLRGPASVLETEMRIKTETGSISRGGSDFRVVSGPRAPKFSFGLGAAAAIAAGASVASLSKVSPTQSISPRSSIASMQSIDSRSQSIFKPAQTSGLDFKSGQESIQRQGQEGKQSSDLIIKTGQIATSAGFLTTIGISSFMKPPSPSVSEFGGQPSGGSGSSVSYYWGKPDFGFGGGATLSRRGKGGRGKRTTSYTPSVTAVAFDIKGTGKQKTFSGLELRPVRRTKLKTRTILRGII